MQPESAVFEGAAAEILRRFTRGVRPEVKACCMEVAGGVAGYGGEGSPLSVVKGVTEHLREVDYERIEAFYFSRGMDALIELGPWADVETMGGRAYTMMAEEHLMVQPAVDGGVDVAECPDREAWAEILCVAFMGEVSEAGMEMGRGMYSMDGVMNLGVEREGRWVAGASMVVLDRVALFAGDGTLPEYRGQGLQQELIRGRMRRAVQAGCEWVHCEVQPGSGSERNYIQCGFEKLYSRKHYLKRRR